MAFTATDHVLLRRALNTLTSPARRHRCKTCKLIFICHLCGVDGDHPIHADHKGAPPYLCERCIKAQGILTIFTNRQKMSWNHWDMLTGELLDSYKYIYQRRAYNNYTHAFTLKRRGKQ